MTSPSHAVVMDFDGTLTSRSTGPLCKLVDEYGGLTPEYLEEAKKLREYYNSRARAGNLKLSNSDAYEWFSQTVNLYLESQLTHLKIREIMVRVRLRDGVKDCLQFLNDYNIPVAIISCGIAEFIEAALEANGIHNLVSEIYAARVVFDGKTGCLAGLYPETAVFPHNKGGFSRIFAKKYDVPLHRLLAVGDSGGDAELGHFKKNRFGLAVNEMEKKSLEKYMGTVTVTENFLPARNWLFKKIFMKSK